MAQATNLVLKNASAVNVNYNPIRIETGKVAVYVDRTQGVIALQPRASLFFKESPTVRRVSGKVTYPVLDATTGAIDTASGSFELILPLKLDLTSRQETRSRLAAMIADAIVTAAVDNGENPW